MKEKCAMKRDHILFILSGLVWVQLNAMEQPSFDEIMRKAQEGDASAMLLASENYAQQSKYAESLQWCMRYALFSAQESSLIAQRGQQGKLLDELLLPVSVLFENFSQIGQLLEIKKSLICSDLGKEAEWLENLNQTQRIPHPEWIVKHSNNMEKISFIAQDQWDTKRSESVCSLKKITLQKGTIPVTIEKDEQCL